MSSYLVFNSLTEAIVAEKQIWINIIRVRVAQKNYSVGTTMIPYSAGEIAEMSDDQVYALNIYGRHQGVIDQEKGLTIRWADIKQKYQLSQWFIKHPGSVYMAGVTGYIEEESDESWWAPNNI